MVYQNGMQLIRHLLLLICQNIRLETLLTDDKSHSTLLGLLLRGKLSADSIVFNDKNKTHASLLRP